MADDRRRLSQFGIGRARQGPPRRCALSVRLACLLLALAVALVARTATAREPERDVTIAIAGPTEDARAIHDTLTELLRRLPIHLALVDAGAISASEVVAPHPHAAPALARIWVDASSPERVTLYVVDGPWERVLVRHVVRAAGSSPALVAEQIGRIVEGVVEALLDGATIGVARAELQAPAPPPAIPTAPRAPPPARPTAPKPTPPAPTAPVGFRPGIAFEALVLGPNAPPTFDIGAASWFGQRSGTVRWGGSLLAAWRPPSTSRSEPIAVRTDALVLRAAASLLVAVAREWHLRFELGGGIDVEHATPLLTQGGGGRAALAPPTTTAVVCARARFGALFRDVLSLGVFVDVQPVPPRYLFELDGASVVAFARLPVQPGLYLETWLP